VTGDRPHLVLSLVGPGPREEEEGGGVLVRRQLWVQNVYPAPREKPMGAVERAFNLVQFM